MTRSKNRVKQKLKGDGRQIADLERAVHKAHRDASERVRGGSHHKRKPKVSKVVNLLGSREVQETAWVAAMLDCERYAARVPITQVTGAVPVDLYRVSTSALGAVNGSGLGFAMSNPDEWHTGYSGAVSAGYNSAQMHANGATAYAGCVTGATYAGLSFPADSTSLTAPPAGVTGLIVPDISSDFVSNEEVGTEYIMVGCKTSLSLVSPGAADRYVGEVWAISSDDIERAPIAGETPSSLESNALKQGSLYRISKYKITGSGLFVPVEEALRGEEAAISDTGGVGELSISSIPLTTGAYEWRRIGRSWHAGSNLQVAAGRADKAFYIYAPSGLSFKIRHTILWQAERYSSALVRRSGPPGMMSAVNSLTNLGLKAAQMITQGRPGSLSTAVASTLANASDVPGFLSQMSSNIQGLGNLINTGGQIAGALQGAIKGGQSVYDAIQNIGGSHVGGPASTGVPSGWTIGRPPSTLPASSVEVLQEETGGSGIMGMIEDGAEEALEFAPELLATFA